MIENKFIVIVPVYNAEKYIKKCIDSILKQDYTNYELIVIDDCSTDSTYDILCSIQTDVPNRLIGNGERLGSASGNIAHCIDRWSNNPEDIIVTVDGDDMLANNHVLSYLNKVYQDDDIYMTYGQFVPMSGSYGKFCKPIFDTANYRKSGAWLASHLRTFKNKLWYKIDDNDLRDANGDYFKVAGDASYMYPLIEMCGTKHVKCIDEVLYLYNDLSPMNDMKANLQAQLSAAEYIRNKPIYEPLEEIL